MARAPSATPARGAERDERALIVRAARQVGRAIFFSLAIIVVSRDVAIVGGILLAAFIGAPMEIKPNKLSKLNTVFQIVFAGTVLGARAFNLKNDRRIELKRLLRELADEGRIEARRKKLHHAGALPSVTLTDVVARDADGEDGEQQAGEGEHRVDDAGHHRVVRPSDPRRAECDRAAEDGEPEALQDAGLRGGRGAAAARIARTA